MIHAKVTRMFFDRRAVIDAVDRATRKVLGHFGGLVRKAAHKSIEETSGPSSPGRPPHSHMAARRRRINAQRRREGKPSLRGGFTGLKYILYAYEPATRSVIIGPASNRSRSMTIPEILECGEKDPKVAARPFIGPAFEQERVKLPALWANSIK